MMDGKNFNLKRREKMNSKIFLRDKQINDLKKYFKKIEFPVEKISKEFDIKDVSFQISEKYEKTISPGQVEAVLRRIMGITHSTKERSQLYDLRKKIRKSEKFLTYFGEWAKKPARLFKVIINGLNNDQTRDLHSMFIAPNMSGERITIGVDFYTKTIESYDKSLTKLQFWNVSGNERFESLREYYYKGAHAMIIVYEKGNQESLKSAKKYYSEFKKATNLKFKLLKLRNLFIETPIILVGLGNKPIIHLEGGPYLAKYFGAKYFDKNEVRREEFEDIFHFVSVELLVKCQNAMK